MPVTRDAVERQLEMYKTEDGSTPFEEWLHGLRDARARGIIRQRLDRIKIGNFGVHKGVGEGVEELIIDFGPGYRVYYGLDGSTIVILLCGGDKKTQAADIRLAKKYWADYRG